MSIPEKSKTPTPQTSRKKVFFIIGILAVLGIAFSLWKKNGKEEKHLAVKVEVEPLPEISQTEKKEKPTPPPAEATKPEPKPKAVEPTPQPEPVEEAKPEEPKEEPRKVSNSIQPSNPKNARLSKEYRQALRLLKQKQYAEAKEILSRDEIIDFSKGRALPLLMKIFLATKDHKNIDTVVEDYLDAYPPQKTAILSLYAHSLSGRKDYKTLIQHLEPHRPLLEGNETYYSLLAQAYLKEKQYQKGSEVYIFLLSEDGSNKKFLMGLLIAQVGMKNKEGVSITLEKLNRAKPTAQERALSYSLAQSLNEGAA